MNMTVTTLQGNVQTLYVVQSFVVASKRIVSMSISARFLKKKVVRNLRYAFHTSHVTFCLNQVMESVCVMYFFIS